MKLAELQNKLIAAARQQPPDDRVPYAFEKRIAALVASRPIADQWALWTRGLWRATVPCVAIAVLLGGWVYFASVPANPGDLSQDFENTLLASVDQSDQAQ